MQAYPPPTGLPNGVQGTAQQDPFGQEYVDGIRHLRDRGLGLGTPAPAGGPADSLPKTPAGLLAAHRTTADTFHHHARALLTNPRFHPLTYRGRRSVAAMALGTREDDGQEYLQADMNAAGLVDRSLRLSLPAPRTIDAQYWRRRWLGIRPAAAVVVRTVVPTSALLSGQTPEALTASGIRRILAETLDPARPGPVTILLCSTSGFTDDARALVTQATLHAGKQHRHLVLIEPLLDGTGQPAGQLSGGWHITTPPHLSDLTPLLDPEPPEAKRRRLATYVQEHTTRIEEAGITPTEIAASLHLPARLVEQELKQWAPTTLPTLAAPAKATSKPWIKPMVRKVERALERRGILPKRPRVEEKTAEINDRRAALVRQRDHLYEYFQSAEQREADLRQQFKDAPSTLTKRRVTSQLLQLRKDTERKQQLLEVLNQQVNVAGIHLHNLDLLRTGQIAKLPDEIDPIADAAQAEDALAELQAHSDLAVTATTTTSLAQEEQDLFRQLESELTPQAPAPVAMPTVLPPVPQPISQSPSLIPESPESVVPNRPTPVKIEAQAI